MPRQAPKRELLFRLISVNEICTRLLSQPGNIPYSLVIELDRIRTISEGTDEIISTSSFNTVQPVEHIRIVTDVSVANKSFIGIHIVHPKDKGLATVLSTPSRDKEEAFMDAIYSGLTTLLNLNNNPSSEIEVVSPSNSVIDILNGQKKSKKLEEKKDLIWEFCRAAPVKIHFSWKPRGTMIEQNSLSNYLAEAQT